MAAKDTGLLQTQTQPVFNEDPKKAKGYAPYASREFHADGINNAVNKEKQRLSNTRLAEQNYERSIGGFSSDPYERAQQNRNFHQTDDFKKFWNPLDPQSQLQDQLGTAAYGATKGLLGDQQNAADDIRGQAGEALGQGLKTTREGANSRGLLYSGMRQGAEQSLRGRVANTMASQISQSNADLSKRASGMEQAAAAAGLMNAQQHQEAQMRMDQINQQNAVERAQQMQQLTGAIGYGFGQAYGGSGQQQSPSGAYGQRRTP